MNRIQIGLFCAASLLASAGVAALLLPSASVSIEQVRAAQTPLAMEHFVEDVDLGPDYGVVPVIELIGYYLENPPAAGGASVERERHFGGC